MRGKLMESSGLFKKAVLVAGISLASKSYACDTCVETQIRLGFNAIEKVLEQVVQQVKKTNEAVSDLSDQIKDSSQENTDAVAEFNDNVVEALKSSADKISLQTQGAIAVIDGSFKLSNSAMSNLFLDLTNAITANFNNGVKTILADKALYEAGGEFGHFKDGTQTDIAFQIYESGATKAKKLYTKHSEFVSSWNNRDSVLNNTGQSTMLNYKVSEIKQKQADLIYSLNNSDVIATEDYQDLVEWLTIGLNPDQILVTDPNYLKLVSSQAIYLTRIMMKAPIVDISEGSLEALGSILKQDVLPPDSCPSNEVRAGYYCTSLKALSSAIAFRGSTKQYLGKLSVASRRAILEELVRSTTLQNLLIQQNNQMSNKYAAPHLN